MTTLDARARSAAHAIRAGVAEFTPAASFDAVVVRQQRWRTMQAGLAGAVTAAIVVLAGLFATPAPEPQVADIPVTPTVVTPTGPTPEGIVVPPAVTTTTEAPETTTTTTTQPVTTTTSEPPDITPPPLTITTPKENEHFEIEKIEFAGTTEPGAQVFAGIYEADVDDKGNWSIVLILSPGANGAVFTATDAAGNEAQARVTVHYDVPEPTTTTEAPKDEIKFTAYNVYGVCDSSPPYDVYWGTAPPGTPITIVSEFGSGSATANEKGDWEVKVYFPEAPGDTEFTVTVKDNKGQKYHFGFKYLI